MMKTKKLIVLSAGIAFLFFCMTGCEKELDLGLPSVPSRLVVEGWIENGRHAEVILSHSAPYFLAIDSNTLPLFAESKAKVTLISPGESEILTLSKNQAYFPPMVYHSVDMKGTAGKAYSIEVILSGDTLRAFTTIPEPVVLDSVWFETEAGETNKGRIWIRLTDDGSEENYYRLLFKRKGKDSIYLASAISTFSDAFINGKTAEMGFKSGMSSLISLEEENYFVRGDTVSVKFCTIDREQFDFWNVYQNRVLAAANPLAISNNQLSTNIEGGLGIWSGYGATYYLVYAK